jgi:hypothetical protein
MHADNTIESWSGVVSYEILKVTTVPFYLPVYYLNFLLKYRDGRKAEITLHLRAEDEEEAVKYARQTFTGWNGVVSAEIQHVSK